MSLESKKVDSEVYARKYNPKQAVEETHTDLDVGDVNFVDKIHHWMQQQQTRPLHDWYPRGGPLGTGNVTHENCSNSWVCLTGENSQKVFLAQTK